MPKPSKYTIIKSTVNQGLLNYYHNFKSDFFSRLIALFNGIAPEPFHCESGKAEKCLPNLACAELCSSNTSFCKRNRHFYYLQALQKATMQDFDLK